MVCLPVFRPKAGNFPSVLKILLFGLYRLPGRSGMSETDAVLVHSPSDLVHVPLFDALKVQAGELELRRAVGF